MKSFKLFILLAVMAVSLPSFGQGLKAFKLKNGLSVFIWEDSTKPDVFGTVAVRTGSVNDPEQYTGLAHYLEHLLFKGTDKISTLNWAEEAPIYNEIIAKYDAKAEETDPVKKEAIDKEINELTIKAAKVSVSNEFSNLMEGMGSKEVNAGTNYDYTLYYNSFPTYQINKWLEISSQRLINPVFRTFQTELETVYEEYNRSQDNPSRRVSQFILEKAFEGHPYSRPVLGLPEHLKNPRLSQLNKFYNEWYTPENMALIIVGNVNANQISARIAATFGKLEKRSVPERKSYPDLEIKGRIQHTAKVGMSPSVTLVYQGVTENNADRNALNIAMSLLSNSSRTGVLDKLVLDGELSYAGANLQAFREQGRCLIQCAPLYDSNQRRYESSKTAEKKVLKGIEQIAKGEVQPWLVDAIKLKMCSNFDLSMESNQAKGMILMDAFINDESMEEVLDYKEKVMSVTIDDVKRVAHQYLNENYLALYIEQGKPNKEDKIKKPGYKPIEPPVGQQSLYAQQFKNLPIGQVEENFMNFNEVKNKKINERSKFFYTPNTENAVFSLILKYGVGGRELPKLAIAAELMNNAGIMGAYTPLELKEQFSKLNVTCRFSANDDYLYVTMEGYENNLTEACQLLSRQLLMPKLDEAQLMRIKSNIMQNRYIRKDNVQGLATALNSYLCYQDKSAFIDELTDKQVVELQISELTGDINRASNYESEVYFTGTLSFDDVYEILSKNLPLVANERPTTSPQDRALAPVKENTVYFLPNSEAEQAQIYIYSPTLNYDKKDDVIREAFYQYFSGSFNGLVLTELREKRSMVYTAYGAIATPALPGSPCRFAGQIGTQNDKAVEALTIYMDLVRNMPRNPERMENIKSYLRQEVLTSHPDFRFKSQYFEAYKQKGYTQDPAIEKVKMIDALTFEDIVKFYEENVKGKPFAIGVMGNPKDINADLLSKFGKVIRLNEKKLFNQKDALY